MSHDRKTSFKVPPSSVRDATLSQETRRKRALEEQKRRRAERIDTTRQLDIFADLSLGQSDDETDVAEDLHDRPEILRQGVSQFAPMLPSTAPHPSASVAAEPANPIDPDSVMNMYEKKGSKTKRKGKGRASERDHNSEWQGAHQQGGRTKSKGQKKSKANKWADKCMYAELLEMNEGFDVSGKVDDGIPDDIETGWVAVTPVPTGKRCLAITHLASGVAGVVPNTTLRSRVLGKTLMKAFPSVLPPQTVLDCILDENWRDNGILHVLDVLSWKGQDLADCETSFRFWWRDTRLSELTSFPPPSSAAAPTASSSEKYQFPHPTTFAPIPYHTDTSLAHILSTLIPLTRTMRSIPISIPVSLSDTVSPDEAAMDLGNAAPLVELKTVHADVQSDGLLLYVAQASYEPGTSPLSTWVPVRTYQTREEQQSNGDADAIVAESPLDVFARIVSRRLTSGQS